MAKEAKTNKKENSKNKKSFWKDFKAELKKVVWPSPKQLVNNTIAVVTIVLITAAIVFVLDLTFETINKYGIEKVKEIVEASNETTQEVQENTESVEGTEENAVEESTESTETTDTEVEVVEDTTESVENVENNTENNAQ